MNAAEQKWLHELIVGENARTRTELRHDINRIERKTEDSHHRLRTDLQKYAEQHIRLDEKVDGMNERVKVLEGFPPNRHDDDPAIDYSMQRRPVVILDDKKEESDETGNRRISDRDVKIALGTLAIAISLLKVLPAIITWAQAFK